MPLTLTRSFLVIFLPGCIALLPWLVLAVREWPSAAYLYEDYPAPISGLIIGASIVLGKIFESTSSRIEISWDKARETEYSVNDNWYIYLTTCTNPEPVGFRYIGRLVTSLYFELTMFYASVSFFIGGSTLLFVSDVPFRWLGSIGLFALAIFTPILFWRDAKLTHSVLCKTRMELNSRMRSAT